MPELPFNVAPKTHFLVLFCDSDIVQCFSILCITSFVDYTNLQYQETRNNPMTIIAVCQLKSLSKRVIFY